MKTAAKDKIRIVIMLVILTAVCLSLVAATAHITALQYDINKINNQISESQWTQRNLEAEIKSSNTLASLEEDAMGLGLVYPGFDEIIYLDRNEDSGIHNLSLALKADAYNK